MLRIFSWNVNGLRAVLNKKALQKLIEEQKPNILCLQEIKAKPEQVGYKFPGYKVFWNPAKRAGYSGTAILFSEESLSLLSSADLDTFDVRNIRLKRPNLELYASESNDNNSLESSQKISCGDLAIPEGRILTLDLEKFYLVNVYVPNAKPDLSRLKLREKEWDPEFLQFLKELEKTKPVVVCGDFNVAHEEIDIARPKTNHHSAGFTDEERQGMTNYLNAGLIDTFRTLHPKTVRYTWWSHWGKARENNVGWRIDYFLISKNLRKNLKSAEIYENYMGSDHCPISIDLEV